MYTTIQEAVRAVGQLWERLSHFLAPRCPYCGSTELDYRVAGFFPAMEDPCLIVVWEYTCRECGRKFFPGIR